MTLQELITAIAVFSEKEVQQLIAELERERFGHQGAFNDHERWKDNQRGERKWLRKYKGEYYPYKTVEQDKGFNQPLVDSGRLSHELETASNWNLQPSFSKNSLTLTVPDEEKFTNPVYDKLEFEQGYTEYISPRGNYVDMQRIPARPFKAFSDADIGWIVEKLVEKLKDKF